MRLATGPAILVVLPLLGCGSGVRPPLFDYAPETMTRYRLDGTRWTKDGRQIYVYDRRGKLVATRWDVHEDGEWKPSELVLICYDRRGRFKSGTELERDESWRLACKCVFRYDAAGTLGRHVLFDRSGKARKPARRALYSYDSGSRLEKEEVQDHEGGDWKPKYRAAYTYDPTGRLQTKTDYSHPHGTWVIDLHTRYYYGESGRLEREASNLYSCEEREPDVVVLYEYDSTGNLRRKAEFLDDEGTPSDQSTFSRGGSGGRRTLSVHVRLDDGETVFRCEYVFTNKGTSFGFEATSAPGPLAKQMLELYGNCEVNRHLW